MKTALLLAASATYISPALSWGAMGHETVGYIAMSYMNTAASSFTKSLLGSSTLADVAPWADTFRYTTSGAWSAGYHFIDAEDSPPDSCNVQLSRDCKDGCVVTAIQNYTTQLLDTKLSSTDRATALKFVVHFLGDVTQPLHDEALDVGGNEVTVYWGKSKTNLHAIWDTNIPETLAGGSTEATAKTFAAAIVKDIKSGIYESDASSWAKCLTLSGTTCALEWATDANAEVCATVIPDGIDAVKDKDLSGDYYTTNAPIARMQLAKAGYRLGLWLNAIAAQLDN